jgi:hypothetical protein
MADREEDLGTYEMLWDCPYCGQKKLLGVSQRHCPSCGGEQDPNKRYFPSDADKVAVKDHPFMGADLLCPFCQAPNSASANNCVACGGELGGSKVKKAALRSEQVVGEGQAFGAESAADAKKDFAAQKAAQQPGYKPPPAPSTGLSKGAKIGIAVGVSLLALILVAVFWKKTAALVVSGHSWERSIAVDEFGPVHQSEWCEHVPFDARFVTRHREVRSYNKVPDGETCTRRRVDKGNGSFSERKECTTKYKDVPVYADKCDFTVDRWHAISPITATGSSVADAPRWPEARLRTGNCVGCQREGGRSESYTVQFANAKDKATYKCTFDATKWASMADGSKWKGKVGAMTGVLSCDTLEPLK